MKSRREYALALARQGFRIFPLLPGSKKPYRSEGWKAIATTNEPQINKWFDERPDMNYAVNCQEDHVILDIDIGGPTNKDGLSEFYRHEDAALGFVEQSIADATFKVQSPKGGFHLYFNSKRGYANSASKLMKDVDVRGPDGYVVGPGCWTADAPEDNTVEGSYRIITDGEAADLPAWLESLLEREGVVGHRASNAGAAAHPVDTKSGIEQATQTLRMRRPAIEHSQGDEETIQCAMALKDKGVGPEMCFELMFNKILFSPTKDFPQGRTWNETCEPPWSEEGIRTKIANAYAYGNKPIGIKMDALAGFADDEEAGPVHSCEDGMAQMQIKLQPGEHFSLIPQPIGNDGKRERVRNMLMSPDDFLAREMEYDSIIHGWIPAQSVIAVLAKRGTGKSVMLQDMCFRIACDMQWNGIDIAKDWACVYLCGEDDRGLMANFTAWKLVNKREPAADRLILAPAVPNLMDAEDVENWALELKAKLGDRRVVVFIDTWQRATSQGDQNDNKEMQKAIAHAEAIAKHLKGCSIIAFHPPKGRDDTISGSMIMENSTSAIILLTEAEGGGQKKAFVHRLKGGQDGSYAFFKIKAEDLGTFDKQNNSITGALPNYGGGDKIGEAQQKIIDADAARAEICRILEHTLQTRTTPITFKEIAPVIERAIIAAPDGILSRYYPNTRKAKELEEMLGKLFTITDDTRMPNGKDIVRFHKNGLKHFNGDTIPE